MEWQAAHCTHPRPTDAQACPYLVKLGRHYCGFAACPPACPRSGVDVGPAVIPSVALIRERFTARRQQPGTLDTIARKALGMDAKLRQYSDGAAFVRQVVDRVGMNGFNQVWASPTHLPTRAEIHDPELWIDRVSALP